MALRTHTPPAGGAGKGAPARRAKIARVWCLARDLNLSGELLHVCVEGVTGKSSIAKLSNSELASVIKTLETTLDQRRKEERRARQGEGIVLLPTPQQRALVADLMAEVARLRNIHDPEAYLRAICKKTFGREYHKLTGQQTQSLTEALKSIIKRSKGGDDGSVVETDGV